MEGMPWLMLCGEAALRAHSLGVEPSRPTHSAALFLERDEPGRHM